MSLIDEFDATKVSTESIRYVGEPADGAKVVRRQRVTCCRPWCQNCGSWSAEELYYDDNSVWTLCATCRKPVGEWPEK